jgi:uncharacterized protein YuzE
MSIMIGNHEFDDVAYDDGADVLYLSVGPPEDAIGERTPEGHVVLIDEETGEVRGVTLIGPRSLREARGGVSVTLPEGSFEVEAEGLDLAMGAFA